MDKFPLIKIIKKTNFNKIVANIFFKRVRKLTNHY